MASLNKVLENALAGDFVRLIRWPDCPPWWTIGALYMVRNEGCMNCISDDNGDIVAAAPGEWEIFRPGSPELSEAPATSDIIDNPSHYASWPIQPIEFCMRNRLEGHVSNIVKYATRAGHKLYPGLDQDQSEVKDLEKAISYAQRRINLIQGEAIV